MKLILAEEAENDLETIGDYIARDNPSRAVSFVREIREKCEALVDLPRGYPVVDGYEARQVRRCNYKSYAIFYVAAKPKLQVVRVLNTAQDYRAML